MHGAVALVGGGEFEASMEAFDRGLLEATGRVRPRVVLLFLFPRRGREDEMRLRQAIARAHFEPLGAEVEDVVLRTRADADDESTAQALGEADVVYVANARVDSFRRSLAGTVAWAAACAAHERGAVMAGAGGGAAALVDRHLRVGRRRGWPIHWSEALGICPSIAVLPGYDRMPEPLAALYVLHAPRGMTVLGIDRGTGVVGRDGAWQVQGAGRVTVWRGRRRERLGDGDVFRV